MKKKKNNKQQQQKRMDLPHLKKIYQLAWTL